MEISHVSGYHRELVHLGNGCNHRVLRPGHPQLDLMGFARILFACEFDASLDLADAHAGEMEIDVIGALQPSEHSAMGPPLPAKL